jgi:hypothetical protein
LPLVGSSGDLSLLWRQTTNNGVEWRVYSSRGLPDGSWDAPATVSASGENAGAPRGGVDQSGNVTAVFLASTRVAALRQHRHVGGDVRERRVV